MIPHTQIQITAASGTADPTTDEVAAAVAAIVGLMTEGARPQDSTPALTTSWSGAAKLVAQGLVPGRTPTGPGWGRIERIRRAGKGGSGITGL
ncbi:MAG: hypothetical protein WCJ55_08045 [Chloroflexales bacterium]